MMAVMVLYFKFIADYGSNRGIMTLVASRETPSLQHLNYVPSSPNLQVHYDNSPLIFLCRAHS